MTENKRILYLTSDLEVVEMEFLNNLCRNNLDPNSHTVKWHKKGKKWIMSSLNIFEGIAKRNGWIATTENVIKDLGL